MAFVGRNRHKGARRGYQFKYAVRCALVAYSANPSAVGGGIRQNASYLAKRSRHAKSCTPEVRNVGGIAMFKMLNKFGLPDMTILQRRNTGKERGRNGHVLPLQFR